MTGILKQLGRIQITTKLYVGFSAVLLLLGVVAVIAVTGLRNAAGLLGDYCQTARTSLALADLQEGILEAGLAALKHRASASDDHASAVVSSTEVSRTIQSVSSAIDRSEQEASGVSAASDQLSQTSASLRGQVETFLHEVRAA